MSSHLTQAKNFSGQFPNLVWPSYLSKVNPNILTHCPSQDYYTGCSPALTVFFQNSGGQSCFTQASARQYFLGGLFTAYPI